MREILSGVVAIRRKPNRLKDVTMKNDSNDNGITRRKCIAGGAAAAAVPILSACGGGDPDDVLGMASYEVDESFPGDGVSAGEESLVRAASTTPPLYIVPETGQYHVEVVYATTLAANPQFRNGYRDAGSYPGEVHTNAEWKPATSSVAHKVSYMLIQATSTSRTQLNFNVYFPSPAITLSAGGGKAPNAPRTGAYVRYVTRSTTHVEWWFYWGDQVAVILRLIKLSGSDIDTSFQNNPGPSCAVRITNTGTHANAHGQTTVAPKKYPTGYNFASNHATAIKDSSANKADTVVLPNPNLANHRELHPVLGATSGRERNHLKRRFARHLDAYAQHLRNNHTYSASNDQDLHHTVGNEIIKLVGGAALVDRLNEVRANLVTRFTNNLNYAEGQLNEVCTTLRSQLENSNINSQNRALLDTQATDMHLSKANCGFSVSTSAQFIMTGNFPLWDGLPVKAGVRVSFGMARASWVANLGVKSSINTYTLANAPSAGFKLMATGILGPGNLADGTAFKIKNTFTCDLEVTVVMTIQEGKCRIDAIQFDPVFDLDTREWVRNMIVRVYRKLLADATNLASTHPVLPTLNFSNLAAATNTVSRMKGFAQQAVGRQIASFEADALNKIGTMSQNMYNWLNTNAPNTRTWGTLELSPLRFVIPNSDVNNPDVPQVRSGFRSGGVGWAPGVKYIAGVGYQNNFTLLGATFTVQVRWATVADGYLAFGSDAYSRSLGFKWDD